MIELDIYARMQGDTDKNQLAADRWGREEAR